MQVSPVWHPSRSRASLHSLKYMQIPAINKLKLNIWKMQYQNQGYLTSISSLRSFCAVSLGRRCILMLIWHLFFWGLLQHILRLINGSRISYIKYQFFKDMMQLLSRSFFFSSTKNLLKNFGIINPNIARNLSAAELYESGLNYTPADPNTKPNRIASTGAFVAFSGARTGRSPASKSIVNDAVREKEIAWGDVNKPIAASSFNLLSELAKSYLNTRRKVYVVDGYAGWDKNERIRIRVMCTRSYHALFMTNMLIKPTQEELERDFHDGADYYIFNAGEFGANKHIPGVVGETAVSLNFELGKMVILGSQYAGEMKKGVFTIMNYLMPKKGHLPLHSSCNVGKNGDVCLFFGLSGTGKTALSAVGDRELIGDDEHVWTDKGVFNIEGGCYAKCVGLSAEKEPEIYNAIKFGTVLENVGYDEHSRVVNYNDISITENTRASYPLQYIPNAKLPAVTGHAKNIVFLTCDAFSVLPPVSKLTPEQAIYHFYSGYTAKIAGTEQGVKEPTPTFSACFGEAFLPLKPQVYADLLLKKIKEHGTHVWLVNTGWTGGRYGIGKRISIEATRNIVNAIHDGSLANAKYETLPIFNLQYPTELHGVDSKILNPETTWANKDEYKTYLRKVAEMFNTNFKRFEHDASEAVKQGAPVVPK